MHEFPTSASRVGSEVLQRLCTEWKSPVEPIQIRASSKSEAVRLLNDSNSDMVKLLTELGWRPPSDSAVPVAEPSDGGIAGLPSLGGDQSFFNPVNNNTDIESYDRRSLFDLER